MTVELHFSTVSCLPCFTYASSPEKPLLMGQSAVVTFYNNWLVTQLIAQCVPCTCCCPSYQKNVANNVAHNLLPVEDFLKLLYLPKSTNVVEAYNAFKLDHDKIIDSYRTSGFYEAYKCAICFPVLAPLACVLPWCYSRANKRTYKEMAVNMAATVDAHREQLMNAGIEITTAHIVSPYPKTPARFPFCCKTQEECYRIPYASPAVVMYKAGTKPPIDIDKVLTEHFPNYSNFMWK